MAVGFFLVRQLFTGRRELRALAAVMISLAVALGSYGLYQYFYEMPATRAAYEKDPQRALADADMDFAPDSPERVLFEKRLQSVEPMATFALTNSLAGFLAPWLIATLGIAILGHSPGTPSSPQEGDQGALGGLSAPAECLPYKGGQAAHGTRNAKSRPFRRIAGWLTASLAMAGLGLPMGACLLLTKSRSAYLAILIGLAMLAVVWWLERRREKARFTWRFPAAILLGGAIATAGVAGAVAVGGLDAKVLSEASKSLGYRIQYWKSSIEIIADHPWLGCGPGQFQHAYTQYKLPEASEEIADPHNFILEIWATAGTVALVAALALLGSLACSSFRGSAGHVSADETGTADASRFVMAGGAVGFLLSVPISLMSSAPPGLAAVGIGLPLAALTMATLVPWVDRGRLPARVPAVAASVLLVNLLFAGGIGFPGVAGSFWLLAALALNAGDQPPAHLLRRGVAWIAFLAFVGVALACYKTAYRPVLKSMGAMASARTDPAEAENHLCQAAEADPLAGAPWERLAALAVARIQRPPSPEATRQSLSDFNRYREEALERVPHSAASWYFFGELSLTLFRETGDREHLRQAVGDIEKAIELYPNNCRYRAQFAEALFELGEASEATRQAAEALRLDELTPHTDKKLPDEQRMRLLRTIRSEDR
jgi:O-antigen ligase